MGKGCVRTVLPLTHPYPRALRPISTNAPCLFPPFTHSPLQASFPHSLTANRSLPNGRPA